MSTRDSPSPTAGLDSGRSGSPIVRSGSPDAEDGEKRRASSPSREGWQVLVDPANTLNLNHLPPHLTPQVLDS